MKRGEGWKLSRVVICVRPVFKEGSFKEVLETGSEVNGWNTGRWIGNLLIHFKNSYDEALIS